MTGRQVVIGGGVAGLSAAWSLAQGGAEVVLLEASARAGGLVETEAGEGFLIEHGPDGLLCSRQQGAELAAIGLESEMIEPQARRSAVVTERGLLPLPAGLLGLGPPPTLRDLWTPLLSLRGSLRAALEPWVPVRRASTEETVEAFVRRRFGGEVLERVVEPLMRGLHGVSAAQLGASAALPRLVALEQEGGSVLRGAVARGVVDGARFRSPRDGMEALPRALSRALGERVRTRHPVRRLWRYGEGFLVETERGALEADGVVLATPAHEAARLLGMMDAGLGELLGRISFTDVEQVTLGWRELAGAMPDGSGFLVAKAGPGELQACSWMSRKWSGRAPAKGLLARCFLSPVDGDDGAVEAQVKAELRRLVGLRQEPDLVRVRRRRRLLPIHGPGHEALVAQARQRVRALGALALAGNAYGGLGVADCLRSGIEAAQQIRAVGPVHDTLSAAPADQSALWAAMDVVQDPDLGLGVVALGLVRDLEVGATRIDLSFTPTSPLCPHTEAMVGQLRRVLEQSAPGHRVNVSVRTDVPWSPERMSREARARLGWGA